MARYALLRLLGAIPTLLIVIALAFLMMRAAPGGPFDDERVLLNILSYWFPLSPIFELFKTLTRKDFWLNWRRTFRVAYNTLLPKKEKTELLHQVTAQQRFTQAHVTGQQGEAAGGQPVAQVPYRLEVLRLRHQKARVGGNLKRRRVQPQGAVAGLEMIGQVTGHGAPGFQ